jgi:hypothetical protein
VTDPDQIRAAAEAASDVELLFNNAPKASERQIAAMVAAMLSGSAA